MSTIKNDMTGDSLPALVLHPGSTGGPPRGLHLLPPSLLFIGLPHVCVHSFAHICALCVWNPWYVFVISSSCSPWETGVEKPGLEAGGFSSWEAFLYFVLQAGDSRP